MHYPHSTNTSKKITEPVDLAACRSTCKWSQESTLQEANMAKQRTPSRSLKSIVGTALAGLGLFVLSGNLDAAAAQLGALLSITAAAPCLLPHVVLAALQALQAHSFDHQWFLPGPLQMLVSFWPALLSIIGAA